MPPRKHSHPIYIRWCKTMLTILAFAFPPYMFWISLTGVNPTNSFTEIVVSLMFSLFMMIPFLVSAYFWQDVWIDDEGLLIEFLWRKFRIRWSDMIEVKLAWGFLGQEKNRHLIILVNGLTFFHRAFGMLYGLSIEPGFVIASSINDFQVLKDMIRKHINARNIAP